MKLQNIQIKVLYVDNEGEEQMVTRYAESFESAEENLGKLERFIDRGEVAIINETQ